MRGFEPAVCRSSRGPLLESGAPRLTDRRGERIPRGHSKTAARTFRPQQSGLEQDGRSPNRGRRRTSTFCWRLKAGTPSLIVTGRDASLAVGLTLVSQPWSATCQRGAGSGSSRGVWTPHREGLPVTGAAAEPFVSTRAGMRHRPFTTRSPVRAAACPGGASREAALGERESAAAGRGKGELPCPVPSQLVARQRPADAGPRNSMSLPSLLGRRSSRRTRVGRASLALPTLTGSFARYEWGH
jgi:hypothetical protein